MILIINHRDTVFLLRAQWAHLFLQPNSYTYVQNRLPTFIYFKKEGAKEKKLNKGEIR